MDLSKRLDSILRILPDSQAVKVKVPTSEAKARAFLAKLANSNAARVAAGGVAMVLVLMNADGAAAQTQTTNLSVSAMDGVASVAMRADGSALVTLENGSTIILPAGSFNQTAAGDILVSEGIASQITAAVESASAAGGGIAAVAAPVGLLGVLAAAGGGGGSSDGGGKTAVPATTSGTVIDGYLVGATVFRDLNDNGSLEGASEPNTTTDAQGNWTLAVDPANENAKLVSFGGMDSSTGKAFTGVLTAPAGSTVVTPLTTLVQSYVEAQAAKGTTVDPATAASSLATALGLSGQDLLTLDPIAVIETGGGAADAYQAAAQVASVINATAAASTGDGSAESKAVAAKLAEELISAEEAAAGTGVTALSNPTVIQAALNEGGVTGDNATKIGDQVTEANKLIADASSGEKTPAEIQAQVAQVQEVVQGDLVTSITANDGTLDDLSVTNTAQLLVALRPTVTDATATYGLPALDAGLVVTGTGRPGSTVKVTIDGTDKTVVVGGDGTWDVSFAKADLPETDGTFAIQARGQAAGSVDPTVFTTPASGGTLTLDLTPPTTSFTALPTEAVSLVDQFEGLTFTGTTEVGASVVVIVNDVEKNAVVDSAGNFSVTFDGAVNTGETSVVVTAVAKDTNNNETAPVEATITLQPITALTPVVTDAAPVSLNAQEANGAVVISGTGLAGASIELTVAGPGAPLVATTTVAANGTWAYPVPPTANILTTDGSYSVTAVATLAGGALTSAAVPAGTTVVDVTSPALATGIVAAVDNVLSLEEREGDFTVTGTAEAGSLVAVKIGDKTVTALADAEGGFSAGFNATDLPLSAVSAFIETTVTDTAGNVGQAAQTSLSIEPLSALTPTINTVAQTLGQTGLNNGLTVSGTGREGSTVTVTINGVAKSVLLDGTTGWNVVFATADLPAETGTYDVTFSAAVAGTSLTTATLAGGSLEVDLTAPDGPTIDAITGDDVLDAKEIGSDLVVTGSAAANSTVTVTLGALILTDEVGTDGLFSVTFTAAQIADLPVASTVSAFSTDSLANVSATADRNFTVTPPIIGTAGIDDLLGTENNDVFLLRTEGYTRASAGNDEYDFRDAAIEFQELNYSYLDQGISGSINMNTNVTSTITKGSLGTDTLLDVGNTGDFGFTMISTAQDDTVTFVQDTEGYSYSEFWYKGGNDTVAIEIGDGKTRLSFGNEDSVIVNLATGLATVSNAGAADTTVQINISVQEGADEFGGIEVRGTDNADILIGSDRNDRFIGDGGDDLIDGGAGRDLVRFDRAQVADGIFVELGDGYGQAIGVWNGESFRQELLNIEDVRGSAGNDLIIANSEGSNLRGMDGNDTLIGDNGNDVLRGGNGADVFEVGDGFDYIHDFVIGEDRLTLTDVIFGGGLSDGVVFTTNEFDDAVMTHPDLFGATTFGGGVTAQQLQAAYDNDTLFYQPPATTNTIDGTAGDDVLPGTNANDLINVVGTADMSFGYDFIVGSNGDDFFDLSALGETDAVDFDYRGYVGNGIVAQFIFESGFFGEDLSNGLVLKIGEGVDRIPDLGAAGDGVGLVGTDKNDQFYIEYLDGEYHWVGYHHTGGDDFVTIGGPFTPLTPVFGTLRLSIGDDDSNVIADLNDGYLSSASGSITLDGDFDGSFDNFERPMWEIGTYNGDDNIKGSDSADRFILGGGQDTVDGRGGIDTVRYDRNDISGGVTVDLGQGTATGDWSNETFNHTLISIESVRGSRGDDVFIGSNGNDILDGRAGNDTLTGGGGADLFILSYGHDVILDFDLENDDIDDCGVNLGEPTFAEIQYDGVTSVKASVGNDGNNSLTLKGVDLASLEQWLVEDEFGDVITPGGLDNPMRGTFYGVGLLGEDPLEGVELVSFFPTEIIVSKVTDAGLLESTLTGTNFVADEPSGDLVGGNLEHLVITLDGTTVFTLENINYPVVNFVDELSSFDGVIARDVIITGTAGPDGLGFPAQNVWIDAGDGDDYIEGVTGTSTSVAPGAGFDAVVIDQDDVFDQTFIFIDPADSGVDTVTNFRITNFSDTGDKLLLKGGDDSWSHYSIGNTNILDLGLLGNIVESWAPWMGSGSNVGFFSDNLGNGVLFEIDTSGGTPVLGGKIADLSNLDTTNWIQNIDGAYEHIIDFVDELPQLPEVA
jgi:Ca2+-binding RTX toxin-like protein